MNSNVACHPGQLTHIVFLVYTFKIMLTINLLVNDYLV